MGCNCNRKPQAQGRRATLSRPAARFSQIQLPGSDLPAGQTGPADDATALDSERRRIEKLRRDAVRRSLGIG